MTLEQLVEIVRDEELAKRIFDLTKDVSRYAFYKMSIDLGVKYGPDDLSFSDMLLFSWIANRKK
jgi:hypothetical protein